MNRGAAVLMILAGVATGPVGAQPPTTRVLDCTNGGCHAPVLNHTFLHGPTAVQACDACHDYKDPARHTFELKREGRDLCAFCHIDKSGTEGPVVHDPVAKGQCLSCHDPHGSVSRRMLKRETVPTLCADCHADVLKGSHAHEPAVTDCTACHQAHTSDHAMLLTTTRRELCLTCHQDVGKTAGGAIFAHEPAQGDCLQCHKPHASDQPGILLASPADLCISCHQDVGKEAAAAGHPHSVVSDARSCLNCHSPHGSDHANQLSRDTVSTCLVCHKQPIKVGKDRIVASVAEWSDDTLHKHGQIAQGDCSGCHGVHGAGLPNLLTRPYAGGFYQTYADDAYGLCFKCHDKSLALAPSAEKETAFRDGNRNLHFLHVAKAPQGRSCRACHTVHASRFEAQIADSVTYGQWKLPINFTPLDGGGSCAPGCHRPATYSRTMPPMPAPGAVPVPNGGSNR